MTEISATSRPQFDRFAPSGVRSGNWRAAFVLALATGYTAVNTSVAEAGLRICNATSFPITTAIGRHDPPNGWISEGWWRAEPGGCAEIINTVLHERYYYIYAESLGLKPKKTFAGSNRFCFTRDRFKINEADTIDCQAAGLESGKFFKVDTGDAKNHTVRLTSDGDTPDANAGTASPPAFANPRPAPSPAGGGAGTACQRFPNLC